MTKVKLALLGMLAVYAISLAASAAASAATQEFWDCQKVGTGEGRWNNSHCTERTGTEEWKTKGLTGTETEGVVGTDGESVLESTILSKKIKIICLKSIFKGILMSEGRSEGEVKFSECKGVFIEGVESTVCKVKQPIEFGFTDQLRHNEKGEIEDEFKGILENGETFVVIKIEGTGCALNNSYKVKGTQICELPNATQSLVTHQIVCTPKGSKLTLGSEKAEFSSNEHVNVIGGVQWGAA